jgi:hypothetical protein
VGGGNVANLRREALATISDWARRGGGGAAG